MHDLVFFTWRALIAAAPLISNSFICGCAAASAEEGHERTEQADAAPTLKVSASVHIPDTPNKVLDDMPVSTFVQPLNGKRLPHEVGKVTALTIQLEIISAALLLQAVDAKTCLEFDEVTSQADEEGNTILTFEPLHDGNTHCFSGRALEVQAAGFVPGDYRLRAILRVPHSILGDSNLTNAIHFKVVPKVPFEPSYEWRRVEEWQQVQAGLDVKMPIGGNDFRKARIPQTWKVQAFVLDEMGNKKGAGKIQRVTIARTDSLSAVRAAIAGAALSSAPCLTLSIGGSTSDWAALESSENSTVEGAKLFETGAEIAGVLDRESGVCACYLPEKGRACHVVLTKLEACEKEGGGFGIVSCADHLTAVADCFTRCSIIDDPYASLDAKSVEADDSEPVNQTKEIETVQKDDHVQKATATMLPPVFGEPSLPLLKGWSDLNWGGDVADQPVQSQWARCKLCSYKIGPWGQLGVHIPTGDKLPSGLPSQLASSRYAPWFRTWRATFPKPSEALHEEYDEASSRCDSGKRVISAPAFIVAVYDVINVHHLVTELLLPLFRAIVSTYGEFRDDVVVFLEVGHPEQAPRLQQLLQEAAVGDVPLGMLFRLTRRPVGSAASLERRVHVISSGPDSDHVLCFRDVHFGFDFRNTSSASGVRTQFIDLASPAGREVALWQHMLRERLVPLAAPAKDVDEAVPVTSPSVPLPVGILFVKRLQTRKFKNLIELKGIARDIAKDATTRTLATTTTTTTTDTVTSNDTGSSDDVEEADTTAAIFPPDWKGWTNEVVLERLKFSQQVEQLRKTTVLVAILGQGAVNAAFMRPGSSLVLVVPPNMDAEKFEFANVAVASGVHVFLFECDNTTSYDDMSADAKQKLLDDAKNQKDVLVDPVRFRPMLHLAVASASACDSQSCPTPRVHFWREAEEHWESVENLVAAEKAHAKAEKEAKVAKQKAEERERIQKQLEDQIEKAKAQVVELEGKLAAMILANVDSGDASGELAPQHEEL